jgi:hypothetical protein
MLKLRLCMTHKFNSQINQGIYQVFQTSMKKYPSNGNNFSNEWKIVNNK